jgi:hypothetical protein
VVVTYVVLGISFVLIVLALVALLLQKRYIDSETKQVTEIELPLIGKIRTNVPAIAFLVFGVFLAYVSLIRSRDEEPQPWYVSGGVDLPAASGELASIKESCRTDSNMCFRLEDGELRVVPVHARHLEVADTGRFNSDFDVPRSKSFEQEIARIEYEHPGLTQVVVLFNNDEPQKYLEGHAPTSRALTLKHVVIPSDIFSKERMAEIAAR